MKILEPKILNIEERFAEEKKHDSYHASWILDDEQNENEIKRSLEILGAIDNRKFMTCSKAAITKLCQLYHTDPFARHCQPRLENLETAISSLHKAKYCTTDLLFFVLLCVPSIVRLEIDAYRGQITNFAKLLQQAKLVQKPIFPELKRLNLMATEFPDCEPEYNCAHWVEDGKAVMEYFSECNERTIHLRVDGLGFPVCVVVLRANGSSTMKAEWDLRDLGDLAPRVFDHGVKFLCQYQQPQQWIIVDDNQHRHDINETRLKYPNLTSLEVLKKPNSDTFIPKNFMQDALWAMYSIGLDAGADGEDYDYYM